jgi:hypothetical protein
MMKFTKLNTWTKIHFSEFDTLIKMERPDVERLDNIGIKLAELKPLSLTIQGKGFVFEDFKGTENYGYLRGICEALKINLIFDIRKSKKRPRIGELTTLIKLSYGEDGYKTQLSEEDKES